MLPVVPMSPDWRGPLTTVPRSSRRLPRLPGLLGELVPSALYLVEANVCVAIVVAAAADAVVGTLLAETGRPGTA